MSEKNPSKRRCKHLIKYKRTFNIDHYCYIVCLKCDKYWNANRVSNKNE